MSASRRLSRVVTIVAGSSSTNDSAIGSMKSTDGSSGGEPGDRSDAGVPSPEGKARRLSVTAFFELVLGTQRAVNIPHIVTEVDPKTGALFARNAYNNEFGERVAFLDASEGQRTVSGDRTEFLGRNGRPSSPASMARADTQKRFQLR